MAYEDPTEAKRPMPKPSTSDLLYQAHALQERTDRENLGMSGRLERIRVAFQELRDGREHASSNLYRVLAAEFPASGDEKHG